jgi:signal transduction histidine kinase
MPNDLRAADPTDLAFLVSTVQQATLLLRAGGSGFYLCDPVRCHSSLVAAHNFGEESGDEDLLGRVCESQAAVIDNHLEQPAILAVPSTWQNAVRGVLVVAARTPDRIFDEQDATLVQPLADLAAAMLQQAERLTRMTAQFRALHVIDVALTSSLQLDRVLNLILDKAVSLVGAEHGSLRLLNPDTGELVLKAFTGEGWSREVRAFVFQIGQGITGWVAEHRQPYLCADAHQDPQNVVLFEQMQSGVAVPLLIQHEDQDDHKELLGVLLLESTRRAAFDQHDVELLEALAQEAVLAIQNTTQRQKLQLMHQSLQDAQERRVAAEKWTVMGQAATALAHRINNLVGIVPASAGEIRRTLATLEIPQTERAWIEANLDRIERNGRFILGLASALFRPFQEPGPRARFDVNRLLNEALQAANVPPNMQVIRDYGQDLPTVESSSLLVDIFVELISNARKAMRGQSRKWLEVRTRVATDESGSWVVIEVSDTGAGIAPEHMAHLWDMFQPSSDGLGFGLWWVRTFIEQQGGTIVCDSKPGAGATFTVRLPTHTDLEEPTANASQRTETTTNSPLPQPEGEDISGLHSTQTNSPLPLGGEGADRRSVGVRGE